MSTWIMFAGASAVTLPRCLLNIRAIQSSQYTILPLETSRYLAVRSPPASWIQSQKMSPPVNGVATHGMFPVCDDQPDMLCICCSRGQYFFAQLWVICIYRILQLVIKHTAVIWLGSPFDSWHASPVVAFYNNPRRRWTKGRMAITSKL